MPEAVVREKDPRLVEAGRRGMRSRWGRQKWLKLDELAEPVRRAVEALIAAEQHAQEREKAGSDAA